MSKIEDLRAEIDLVREEAAQALRAERIRMKEAEESLEEKRLLDELARLRESLGQPAAPAVSEPPVKKPETVEPPADKKGDK